MNTLHTVEKEQLELNIAMNSLDDMLNGVIAFEQLDTSNADAMLKAAMISIYPNANTHLPALEGITEFFNAIIQGIKSIFKKIYDLFIDMLNWLKGDPEKKAKHRADNITTILKGIKSNEKEFINDLTKQEKVLQAKINFQKGELSKEELLAVVENLENVTNLLKGRPSLFTIPFKVYVEKKESIDIDDLIVSAASNQSLLDAVTNMSLANATIMENGFNAASDAKDVNGISTALHNAQKLISTNINNEFLKNKHMNPQQAKSVGKSTQISVYRSMSNKEIRIVQTKDDDDKLLSRYIVLNVADKNSMQATSKMTVSNFEDIKPLINDEVNKLKTIATTGKQVAKTYKIMSVNIVNELESIKRDMDRMGGGKSMGPVFANISILKKVVSRNMQASINVYTMVSKEALVTTGILEHILEKYNQLAGKI